MMNIERERYQFYIQILFICTALIYMVYYYEKVKPYRGILIIGVVLALLSVNLRYLKVNRDIARRREEDDEFQKAMAMPEQINVIIAFSSAGIIAITYLLASIKDLSLIVAGPVAVICLGGVIYIYEDALNKAVHQNLSTEYGGVIVSDYQEALQVIRNRDDISAYQKIKIVLSTLNSVEIYSDGLFIVLAIVFIYWLASML